MKADETKRKREILLGINPCIYGLNYHDPAVVVLIDGRVVFGVEEERCNRVKHSKKDAFYYYKAKWSTDPFVHITGRRYRNRPVK